MTKLSNDIIKATDDYSTHVINRMVASGVPKDEAEATRDHLKSAVLSGISLCCNYQISNDGNSSVNPHVIYTAVREAADSMGNQVHHRLIDPNQIP